MTTTHPRQAVELAHEHEPRTVAAICDEFGKLADEIHARHPEIRPVCPACGRQSEGRVGAAAHQFICSHRVHPTR